MDEEVFCINLFTELLCMFVYNLFIIYGLCETTPFALGMKRQVHVLCLSECSWTRLQILANSLIQGLR